MVSKQQAIDEGTLEQLGVLSKAVGDTTLPVDDRRAALAHLCELTGDSSYSPQVVPEENLKSVVAYMVGLCLALDGAHRVISLNESVEFHAELKYKREWEAHHRV